MSSKHASKARLFLGALQLAIQPAGIAIAVGKHDVPALLISLFFAVWGAWIVTDEVYL